MAKIKTETSVAAPYCALVIAILLSLLLAINLPESILDFSVPQNVDPVETDSQVPRQRKLIANSVLIVSTVLAWVIFWLTDSQKPFARLFSLLSAAAIWLLFLAMLLASVQFVIANNGFDNAENGEGSPVAFGIGAILELTLFILASVVLRFTWRAWRNNRLCLSHSMATIS